MASLGFDLQNEAVLSILTLDATKSSEIEGEFLDMEQVRSSIARRLGINLAGAVESERHIDGDHTHLSALKKRAKAPKITP